MKTFQQLDRELPNGFHDAEIRTMSIDYLSRTADLGMNLLVGTPDSENQEAYRPGTVKIGGLLLFFIEPPDPRYPFVHHGSPLNATGFSVKPGKDAKLDALLQRIPAEATVFGFFLDDSNSFLYLAGAWVEFSWDDGGH
jgi:hypothetical protein